MVVPEVACILPSPHQAKQASGAAGIASSTLGRPRNKEVTSRFRSVSTTPSASPTSAPSRRFPSPNADLGKAEKSTASPALPIRRFHTPNVDRSASLSNCPSPRRAASAERRRPSPIKTTEDVSSKGSNGVAAPVPPHRTGVRAELLWPSTRSFTSSVQLERSSLPPPAQPRSQAENKGKYSNGGTDQTLRPSVNVVQKSANTRRPTPERKGTPVRNHIVDQAENARPQDSLQQKQYQNARPGASNGKPAGQGSCRNADVSNNREKHLSRAAAVLLAGKQANGASTVSHSVGISARKYLSVNEGPALSLSSQKLRSESRERRQDSPSRLSRGPNSPFSSGKRPNKAVPHRVASLIAVDQVVNPARLTGQAVELAESDVSGIPDTSDSESVSSGGTTTTSSSGKGMHGAGSMHRSVQGTTAPARFWKNATSRSKQPPDNRFHSSTPELEFAGAAQAREALRYKTLESPQGANILQSRSVSSSPRSSVASSCLLPSQQYLSPSKVFPYRNMPSPVRSRGVPSLNPGSQRSTSAAMMLNFSADVRRGRKGLSQVEEIHLHRIFHNRLLQWRFVNARADEVMNEQITGAEIFLYNVCVRMSDLRSSVIAKKKRLHQARQAEKLHAILSYQKSSLENWSTLQEDHLNALKGSVRALEAAVLRVPMTGVKADVLAVQDAVSSAYDVMKLIETSAAYLLPKAEKSNSLVSEVGKIAAQERIMLEKCASMLATASALEVEERSIQTHLVQCELERARVLGPLMETTASLSDTA